MDVSTVKQINTEIVRISLLRVVCSSLSQKDNFNSKLEFTIRTCSVINTVTMLWIVVCATWKMPTKTAVPPGAVVHINGSLFDAGAWFHVAGAGAATADAVMDVVKKFIKKT